ncbi:MAG: efflux RND transporter periplasmic adaptor subunit [Rhodothermaceae bacterium]|nr:efflux RND transporter periplasmic adaptor subunit [Rhodothermaceae bacterium]
MTALRFPSLALMLALVLAACGDTPAEDPAADATTDDTETMAARPVEVIVVEPGPFEDVIELTGSVEAPEDAMLGAETAGTVTYLAPLGAFVRAGATVAQINPSLAQAGVSQAQAAVQAAEAQRNAAQAQLDLAQDSYDRQEPLYRDSIISALEFRGVQSQRASALAQVAQADAGIAQARAALRQAQTALSNTRVSAPFSGTVESHLMERGEMAAPGLPVARLVSGAGLRVEAGVPERYAGDIEIGTPVKVQPSSYTGEPLGGRVVFVGRAIDTQSRTFPIEASLSNVETPLRPDMVVSLEVSRAVLSDVITLPLSALVRDERGISVYVVDEASTVARKVVELGPSSGGQAVIAEGLVVGDRVIVTGQTTVTEGDRVRVVEGDASVAALMPTN